MPHLAYMAAIIAAMTLTNCDAPPTGYPPPREPHLVGESAAPVYRPLSLSAPEPTLPPLSRNAYLWEPQGDDPALDAELRSLETTWDLTRWFQSWAAWSDNYNLADIMAPSRFRARGWGSCTAFARMSGRWAELHGLPAWFVVFWSPERAHSVTVMRYPADGPYVYVTDGWAIASASQTLAPADPRARRAAFVAAAAENGQADWTRIEVWRDSDGAITERFVAESTIDP